MVNGWIGVHGHFTPPTSPQDRERRWHSMQEAQFLMPEPFEWTPEGTLAYMDKAGLAMQMLSNPPKQPDALKEIQRLCFISHETGIHSVWPASRFANGQCTRRN